MELGIVVDKYTACVKKDEVIMGHLLLGETVRFAKLIFYFLQANSYVDCNVVSIGRRVNLGDGGGRN